MPDQPLGVGGVDCVGVTGVGAAEPLERECKTDTLSESIINGSISYV